MDVSRISQKIAILAFVGLFSGAAFAQVTIYKQVDEDGRVIFTDQPRPNARTISSYQTAARPGPRLTDAQVMERTEGMRRGPPPPPPEAQPVTLYAPLVEPDHRTAAPSESIAWTSPAFGRSADSDSERVLDGRVQQESPTPRSRSSEVERAVFTYASIATPAAQQVDASEAGRRARQEANQAIARPVLVLSPLATERPKVQFKEGVNIYYTVWALTYLIMALGLLYVGWQVFRLVLGEAFPRWTAGLR